MMKVAIAKFSQRRRYHKPRPDNYYDHVSACPFRVPLAGLVTEPQSDWRPCLWCFPEERAVRDA